MFDAKKARTARRMLSFVMALVMAMSMLLGTVVSQPTAAYADQATSAKVSVDGDKNEKGGAGGQADANGGEKRLDATGESQSADKNDGTDQQAQSQKDKDDEDEKNIFQVVVEAVGGFFNDVIGGVTSFVTKGIAPVNAVTEQDLESSPKAALVTLLRNDPSGSDASGVASVRITVQNYHYSYPNSDWDDLEPWAAKVYDDANGSVSSTVTGSLTISGNSRTLVYDVSVADGGKVEFYVYQYSSLSVENTSSYHISMNGISGYTSTSGYTVSGNTWSSPYTGSDDMVLDCGFKSTPRIAQDATMGHATIRRQDPAGSGVGSKTLSSVQVTLPPSYTSVAQYDEQYGYVDASTVTATIYDSNGIQKGTATGKAPSSVMIESSSTASSQTVLRTITYDMESPITLSDGDYVVIPVVDGSVVKANVSLGNFEQADLITSENTTVTEGDDYQRFFEFPSTGETSMTIGFSELDVLPKTSFKLVRQDTTSDIANMGNITIDVTLPDEVSLPSERSAYIQSAYPLYLYSNEAALDADASTRNSYYSTLYPNVVTETDGTKRIEYTYTGLSNGNAIGFDLVAGATIDIHSDVYSFSAIDASGITPSEDAGHVVFTQPNAATELTVGLSVKPMGTMPLHLSRDDTAFGDDTAGTFTSATLDIYLEGYTTSANSWGLPYANPSDYPIYLYQSPSDESPTEITPAGQGQTMQYTFDLPDGGYLSGDIPKASSAFFSAGSSLPTGTSLYFRKSSNDPVGSYINDLISDSGCSGIVGIHKTPTNNGIRISRPATDTYEGPLAVVATVSGVDPVASNQALTFYDGDEYHYSAIVPVITTSGGVSTATYSFSLPKHPSRSTWVAVNWKYDPSDGVPTVTVGSTLPDGKLLQFNAGEYIAPSSITNNGDNSFSFAGSITRPSSWSVEEPWAPEANLTVADDPNYNPGADPVDDPVETTSFTLTRTDPAGSVVSDPVQLELVEELPDETGAIEPTDYPMTVTATDTTQTIVNPSYDGASDPNTLTYTPALNDGDSLSVPLIRGSKVKMRALTGSQQSIDKASGEGSEEDGWITFDVGSTALEPTVIEAKRGGDAGDDPTPSVVAEGTITIAQNPANSGTTYDAYRVFQGPVSTEGGQDKASTLTWDASAPQAAILSFLNQNGYQEWLQGAGNASTSLASNPMLAAQFISEKIADTTVSPTAVAASGDQPRTTTGGSFATGLAAVLVANGTAQASDATAGTAYTNDQGYYLFVSDPSAIGNGNEAGTAPIWSAITSTPKAITEKVAVPTLTKQVQDDASGAAYGKAADANVGQDLPYRLTATMPENVLAYGAYGMTFTDTLPSGMSLAGGNASSVSVSLDGTDITGLCSVSYESDVLTVVASNLMDQSVASAGVTLTADSNLVVDYRAHLDADYAQGSAGNMNGAVLTYSADPMDASVTSQTPQQNTFTYAHTLSVEKVDRETRLPLGGAQFTIVDDASGKFVAADGTLSDSEVRLTTDASNGTITVDGVDSGTYTIAEVSAPAGYRAVADTSLTITPAYDAAGAIASPYAVSASGENFADVVAPATTVGANEDGVSVVDASLLKAGVRISDLREIVLPLTGMPLGMGVAVYGSILLAISLAVYIRNKRIKDQIAELEDMAA